ncbi:hypothetical protein NP493_274g03028 [Ridgeia piscesae]|uniref:Uncharacterized protein n=1 Tax=Ridgeia piscesae TaxID=27915 RepID=A0AAD9UCI9_RIDPI|nr:hypothetical protein NP493_274g03028 [Ridgeia piscesae]
MSDDFMRCYLTTHREVLEEYVMTFIDIDTLARWMEKKVKLSDDLKKQVFAATRLNLASSEFTRPLNEKIYHARRILKCLDI